METKANSASIGVYFARRLLQAIPVVFTVIVTNFVIINVAPGDPVTLLAGEVPSAAVYESIRIRFGLDKPLPERLVIYIMNVIRGDLGTSYIYGLPVINVVVPKLAATLILAGAVVMLASGIGILIGVISSRRPHGKTDNVVTVLSFTAYSMPVFWLGQILQLIFAIKLGWLPAIGSTSLTATGFQSIIDLLSHLILPVSTLSFFFMVLVSRLTRTTMIEVAKQDYVTAARSKGLNEWKIVEGYTLRNALAPVITLIGTQMGYLLAGTVLTETVFAYPGVGSLMVTSVYSRDYPVLMGLFIISSLGVVIANLVADLITAILDPRIRYN